jgi:hypothetical protein
MHARSGGFLTSFLTLTSKKTFAGIKIDVGAQPAMQLATWNGNGTGPKMQQKRRNGEVKRNMVYSTVLDYRLRTEQYRTLELTACDSSSAPVR